MTSPDRAECHLSAPGALRSSERVTLKSAMRRAGLMSAKHTKASAS